MRKNFVWSTQLNRALSATINNGVLGESYKQHVSNTCPPLSTGDKVPPLSLSNLGTLFLVGMSTGVLLSLCKLLPLIYNRQRPSLPLRSVISNSGSDNIVSRPPEGTEMLRSIITSSRLNLFTHSLATTNIFQPSIATKEASLKDFTFADGTGPLATPRERPSKFYYVT